MATPNAVQDQTSLIVRREIKAPAKAVFKALIDPTAIRQWFGPSDEFTVLLAEADARIGGRYLFAIRSPQGEEHRVSGIYREIAPDRRLVFTWAWASTPERESLVTIELHEKDGLTALVLTHERFADKEARDRHEHGWIGTFARLDRYLTRGAGGAA